MCVSRSTMTCPESCIIYVRRWSEFLCSLSCRWRFGSPIILDGIMDLDTRHSCDVRMYHEVLVVPTYLEMISACSRMPTQCVCRTQLSGAHVMAWFSRQPYTCFPNYDRMPPRRYIAFTYNLQTSVLRYTSEGVNHQLASIRPV